MAEEAGGGGDGGAGTAGETTAAAAAGGGEEADLGFFNRKLHNFPLIRVSQPLQLALSSCLQCSLPQCSDMNEEMRSEAMELCVTACEKHASSNEVECSMTYS